MNFLYSIFFVLSLYMIRSTSFQYVSQPSSYISKKSNIAFSSITLSQISKQRISLPKRRRSRYISIIQLSSSDNDEIYEKHEQSQINSKLDSEIIGLAAPAVAGLIIDPFLSVVDTGYIARLGTISLAPRP